LAVQAFFVLNAFWVKMSTREASDAKLFEDLNFGTVASLSFSSEGGAALELKRDEDGTWVIPQESGYPADADKVEQFIQKVQKLDKHVVIASTKASHKRLKVAEDKFNRKVTINEAGTGKEYVLYLGTSPSQGQLHVRRGSDDRVYLTRDLSAWEAGSDPASWLDRNYVDIPTGNILTVELETRRGRFMLEKEDDGKWTMDGLAAGEMIDSNAVDVLVNRLVTIRMQDVLGQTDEPTYGLATPDLKATISYRTDEEAPGQESLTLVVGPKNETKSSYIVKSSKSPFFVSVPAYALREPIDAERGTFIAKSPADSKPSTKR